MSVPAPQSSTKRQLTYEQEMSARLKAIRDERGWTQAEMAAMLQIGKDRYTKIEQRGRIPAHLLFPLTLASGVELMWLVTGHGPMRKAESA